ncbi:hypothetical protein M5689_004027 [Euphorbia peplus]|nr:hypothetical protein M5689_004027 [Euphorbia peplus]
MFYNECAESFHCGSLGNLSSPFWMEGRRSEMCGLQGFNLQCRDEDVPLITIENQDFYILSLNQSQDEMTLVRMDMLDDLCPDEITDFTNITLNAARFGFASDFYTKFSNITLFYNCTDLTNNSYRFVCPINGEARDAFYDYDGRQGGELMEEVISKCTIKVDIPVPKTALQDDQLGFDDLSRALKQGFNVSYRYNEDCVSCRGSGGICGTNLTTWDFTCFCSDQPYRVSCPNKSGIIFLALCILCFKP